MKSAFRCVRRMAVVVAAIACGVVPSARVHAADVYPDRVVRIVLGQPPGTGSDLSARAVAEALSRELGQPFIVDNRPGAEGILAVGQVTAAHADGHTLLWAMGSQIVVNPAVFASLPYDPSRDLAPVSLLTRQVLSFAVNPAVPAASMDEFIAYARANAGRINYSSGTTTFMLAGESIKRQAGISLEHIPYTGVGQAVAALVAGTVQASVSPLSTAMPQAVAGKIRVLAVSGARLPQLPNVPTFAEVGIVEDVPVWSALYAPAGTPRPVVDRLHDALVKVMAPKEMRDRFAAIGDVVVVSSPEELAATAARDAVAVEKLVRQVGLPKR